MSPGKPFLLRAGVRYILLGFGLLEFVLAVFGLEFDELLVFDFDPEVDAATTSVNPPARVTTHMLPYSGCGPHEMPATL